MGCFACHTDQDWSKPGAPPVAGKEGSGHVWSAQDLPWLVAPNITPDKETGIGNWSDDTLARAIREGIGHDGRALFPVMPYPHYSHMSDEDLASVIAYLRTVPAVRKQLPTTKLPFPINFFNQNVPQPVTAAVPPPDQSTAVARAHTWCGWERALIATRRKRKASHFRGWSSPVVSCCMSQRAMWCPPTSPRPRRALAITTTLRLCR